MVGGAHNRVKVTSDCKSLGEKWWRPAWLVFVGNRIREETKLSCVLGEVSTELSHIQKEKGHVRKHKNQYCVMSFFALALEQMMVPLTWEEAWCLEHLKTSMSATVRERGSERSMCMCAHVWDSTRDWAPTPNLLYRVFLLCLILRSQHLKQHLSNLFSLTVSMFP